MRYTKRETKKQNTQDRKTWRDEEKECNEMTEKEREREREDYI